MSKPAPSDYPLADAIAERWSPRAYSAQPVETDKLLTVLEAARWAASSYGVQPWSFIVATKDEPAAFDRILSVLVPFNQGWAAHAPVLIVSVANTVKADGTANGHAFYDTGAAAAQLSIQAASLGLQAHQMSGFDVAKAKEVLQIPEGSEPMAVITLGYVGDPETLPDFLKERELALRSRKPLSEFVYNGAYGIESSLVK